MQKVEINSKSQFPYDDIFLYVVNGKILRENRKSFIDYSNELQIALSPVLHKHTHTHNHTVTFTDNLEKSFLMLREIINFT